MKNTATVQDHAPVAEKRGESESTPPLDKPPEDTAGTETVVAEDIGADEGPSPEQTADTPTRRRWSRRTAIGVIVVIVLASLTANGWLGWQWKIHRDIDAASQQALDTATQYVVTLTSIDTNSIDRNFTDVLNGATGGFKDMYSQSSAQLRQLLIDNKATSHGTVTQAAIKSATTNKVDVLLFVDQSVSNTANPQPRIDRSRILMTMERVDGRWLASNVELV